MNEHVYFQEGKQIKSLLVHHNYGRFLVSGPNERYRNRPDRSEQRTGMNGTAFERNRSDTVHSKID